MKQKIIDSHPSTEEFLRQQDESERMKETQAPVNETTDDLNIMTLDDWTPTPATGQNTSQCMPEIERELNIFFQMPPVPSSNVDILQWWKTQQVNFPLLSEVARGVYCIPSASSSSERVFSASGGIMTDKRYNLAVGSLKMLTLCKVNYDFVSDIMTIKTMSREEENEQIRKQLMSDLQMTTPGPSTSAQTTTTTPNLKSKTQTKLSFKTVTKPVNKTKNQLICLSSSSNDTSPEHSPPPTLVRKTTPCLPPGVLPVEEKGKGKGKSSARKRLASEMASEMDTQELPPTQIRKRPKNSGLTPRDIQETLDRIEYEESPDMFGNEDDEDNDPDFTLN